MGFSNFQPPSICHVVVCVACLALILHQQAFGNIAADLPGSLTQQVFTLHSWGSWSLKRNPPKNSQQVGQNTDGAYKMLNKLNLESEQIVNFPVSNGFMMVTLPETNIAPENGWLEYEVSVWDGLLAGAMLVLGSVMNQFLLNKSPHGFGYCF